MDVCKTNQCLALEHPVGQFAEELQLQKESPSCVRPTNHATNTIL